MGNSSKHLEESLKRRSFLCQKKTCRNYLHPPSPLGVFPLTKAVFVEGGGGEALQGWDPQVHMIPRVDQLSLFP